MTITCRGTKDGQQVGEHEAFDERGQLKDGYSLRSPVMLRDAAPTEGLTADQRREQTAKYNARIGDAWKNPAPVLDRAADARVRASRHPSAASPLA